MSVIAPSLIQRTESGVLVRWPDGHESLYPFAYLRRRCPCAECRNSSPKVVEADDPLKLFDEEPIQLEDATLVGRYAVQFFWNDKHRHGIYSFDYLRSICPCPECTEAS